jgi:hypothetical protein
MIMLDVLYELMLPIGHVPTQIYVSKTYIPHYNLAIIYIYFLEYIFFYIFFTLRTMKHLVKKNVRDYVKRNVKH